MRYFSSREIYARLSSIYRKKILSFDELTIMRWCAEITTEIVSDPENFFLVEGQPIGVPRNNMVSTPINMVKMVSVYDTSTGEKIPFRHVGNYLHLNDNNGGRSVSVDYYAIPVDEEGFPLINEGFERACMAYCTMNMYREDYMENRIDVNRWHTLESDNESEMLAAAASWKNIDRNYVKDLMDIMVNDGYKKIVYGKVTR
jgi:hypothetical protein